jgi:hypothetical protein
VLDALSVSILRFSAHHPNEGVVFLLTGGLLAKLVLNRLLPLVAHKDTLIDFGASLDEWAGVRSRDYHRSVRRACRDHKGWVSPDVCRIQCSEMDGECCSRSPAEVIELPNDAGRDRTYTPEQVSWSLFAGGIEVG